MFNLGSRHEKLGQSLGNGFVNRLGEQGVMPDILFYSGQPRNRLYEYYLDGPADVIVEFIQAGCDRYTRSDSAIALSSRRRALSIGLSIRPKNRLNCFASVEVCYQPQTPDTSEPYCISSIPGLTFKPDRIWLAKED